MASPTETPDLLDLKLMPAWVNEPARANEYADFEGEDYAPMDRDRRGGGGDSRSRRPKSRDPRSSGPRDPRAGGKRPESRGPRREGPGPRDDRRPPREAPLPLPEVGVRFLPHPPAFESVIAQIKSATITYSVFALARMFLEKPERYDVQLIAKEGASLVQLGEGGPAAADARVLEGGAFPAMKDEFYTVEVTQTEPIKGNFSNVARDRVSGVLLGPTNHHAYQPQLRGLYEQRYSRRMSFQDFQRQIEIVSDPTVVEQWKEQARSVTVYKTKDEEPVTFTSAAEAERHFRQAYLPTLLRNAPEVKVSGVASRRLPDRGLNRVIENAWTDEMRSPSKIMQELASGLRNAGLNIFRHRRGMLFVSPMRIRTFGHERANVSPSINSILGKLTDASGVNRKQLAENLVEGLTDETAIDRVKLSLASDLRWLISEGYVIEFNDGTLELPRPKAPKPAAAAGTAPTATATESAVPAPSEAEAANEMVDSLAAPASEETVALEGEQTVGTETPAASMEQTTPVVEQAPAGEPTAESGEEPEESIPSPS